MTSFPVSSTPPSPSVVQPFTTMSEAHASFGASANSHGHVSSDTSGSIQEKLDSHAPTPVPAPELAPASAPAPQTSNAPDGGLVAWLQVIASFMLFFNSWGLVNTYGAYQTFYEANLLAHQSSSSISWIGSIQAFLLLLVGPLSGPLFDRGYVRALNLVGTFLIVFGLMMTSISTRYYQIFLAQGICTGLGMGAIFIQSVAILPPYFSKRRALANGISVCGSSLGGIIYPVVFQRLEPRIGFGWATRVLAFIALATQAVAVVLMRQRDGGSSKSRSLIDQTLFTEKPMLSFSFASLFAFMGLYIREPQTHLHSGTFAGTPFLVNVLLFREAGHCRLLRRGRRGRGGLHGVGNEDLHPGLDNKADQIKDHVKAGDRV